MSVMETLNNIRVGDTLEFQMYGSPGFTITDGEVVSIKNAAVLSDPALASARHSNIYPAIDNVEELWGTLTYQDYRYLEIVQTVGQDTVTYEVGFPWIITSTIITGNSSVRLFKVSKGSDGLRDDEVAIVTAILSNYGYTAEIVS